VTERGAEHYLRCEHGFRRVCGVCDPYVASRTDPSKVAWPDEAVVTDVAPTPGAGEVWCWEDHRDVHGKGSTCTLPDGHEGAHEFTPDSEIAVGFQ
jgi:hypothetical protein